MEFLNQFFYKCDTAHECILAKHEGLGNSTTRIHAKLAAFDNKTSLHLIDADLLIEDVMRKIIAAKKQRHEYVSVNYNEIAQGLQSYIMRKLKQCPLLNTVVFCCEIAINGPLLRTPQERDFDDIGHQFCYEPDALLTGLQPELLGQRLFSTKCEPIQAFRDKRTRCLTYSHIFNLLLQQLQTADVATEVPHLANLLVHVSYPLIRTDVQPQDFLMGPREHNTQILAQNTLQWQEKGRKWSTHLSLESCTMGAPLTQMLHYVARTTAINTNDSRMPKHIELLIDDAKALTTLLLFADTGARENRPPHDTRVPSQLLATTDNRLVLVNDLHSAVLETLMVRNLREYVFRVLLIDEGIAHDHIRSHTEPLPTEHEDGRGGFMAALFAGANRDTNDGQTLFASEALGIRVQMANSKAYIVSKTDTAAINLLMLQDCYRTATMQEDETTIEFALPLPASVFQHIAEQKRPPEQFQDAAFYISKTPILRESTGAEHIAWSNQAKAHAYFANNRYFDDAHMCNTTRAVASATWRMCQMLFGHEDMFIGPCRTGTRQLRDVQTDNKQVVVYHYYMSRDTQLSQLLQDAGFKDNGLYNAANAKVDKVVEYARDRLPLHKDTGFFNCNALVIHTERVLKHPLEKCGHDATALNYTAPLLPLFAGIRLPYKHIAPEPVAALFASAADKHMLQTLVTDIHRLIDHTMLHHADKINTLNAARPGWTGDFVHTVLATAEYDAKTAHWVYPDERLVLMSVYESVIHASDTHVLDITRHSTDITRPAVQGALAHILPLAATVPVANDRRIVPTNIHSTSRRTSANPGLLLEINQSSVARAGGINYNGRLIENSRTELRLATQMHLLYGLLHNHTPHDRRINANTGPLAMSLTRQLGCFDNAHVSRDWQTFAMAPLDAKSTNFSNACLSLSPQVVEYGLALLLCDASHETCTILSPTWGLWRAPLHNAWMGLLHFRIECSLRTRKILQSRTHETADRSEPAPASELLNSASQQTSIQTNLVILSHIKSIDAKARTYTRNRHCHTWDFALYESLGIDWNDTSPAARQRMREASVAHQDALCSLSRSFPPMLDIELAITATSIDIFLLGWATTYAIQYISAAITNPHNAPHLTVTWEEPHLLKTSWKNDQKLRVNFYNVVKGV